MYDLAGRATRTLNDDAAYGARWLSDSRRIVYLTVRGELVLLDTVSLARRVLTARVQLPLPIDETPTISPDDRTLFYAGQRSESDIWVARVGASR